MAFNSKMQQMVADFGKENIAEIFLILKGDGYKTSEIADMFGCGVTTVKDWMNWRLDFILNIGVELDLTYINKGGFITNGLAVYPSKEEHCIHIYGPGSINFTQDVEGVLDPEPELVEFIYSYIPGSVLTIIRDGIPTMVMASNPAFTKIFDLIVESEDYGMIDAEIAKEIYVLMDTKERIAKWSNGDVIVENGKVFLHGREIHSTLVDRLMQALDASESEEVIMALANFLERCHENPSYKVVDRLYDFLMASNIKIMSDGSVRCFKVVRRNFTDKYTGKIDNSPGATPWMHRNEVDDNDDVHCSRGLHVCSLEYFCRGGYYKAGDTVVEVFVDPADWVSVPTDYDNSKARVCGYLVGEDITDEVQDLMAIHRREMLAR